MVGNKHKNGIICTFPGCEKAMRTQKFKLHFTKTHLKQGEAYSVEHRRRFEVAREDVLVSSSPKVTAADANGDANGDAKPQEDRRQQEQVQAHEILTEDRADVAWALKQQQHAQQQFEQQLRAAQEANAASSAGVKRPADVMEEQQVPEQQAVDPLVDFVNLMDRRFQELVGKMGEMIEVQKELIDALKGSVGHQAPQLALERAAQSVLKKSRKSNGAPGSAVV